MLIEFEVGNYLSFKDPVRLSMVAANPIKEFLDENTFQAGQYRLLKSAAIYGANASGKSNLLAAFAFMRKFVLSSSKETQVEQPIEVVPFKFDTATENAPSHFEICFLLNDRRYRYGFEADKKSVRKEWLFCTEKQKEESLFLRVDDGFLVRNGFPEGKGLPEKTRSNALFLSVVAQFNGETAGSILKWFALFELMHDVWDDVYQQVAPRFMQVESLRPLILEFIRRADVGIEDLIITDMVRAALGRKPGEPETISKISAVHQKFRDGVKEGLVTTDFFTEESEGTKKLLRIAGPLWLSLKWGSLVTLDELDAKLHPLLTGAIVRLFNSPVSNPKNAQLVFATHDTNLLNKEFLRRDQIWFTEKTPQGATDLYSLAEIKLPQGAKVRNDASFEKNYIQGRYGAIPFLGDLAALPKEAGDGLPHKVQ